ncbi:DUF2785 domain-containing protein [Undibacterium sp. Di24W]|uniref:DUF2785 domain-containing protein n=1 Tax=Undibacterium sp. Di24W TaxID=3413033 RepID=UPI003BEF846A
MKSFYRFAVTSILLSYSAVAFASCPPDGKTQENLLVLKESKWQIADAQQRQQSALNLLDCLASPDPQLRDEIAFEALSFWMRSELLTTETIQTIRQQLQAQISAPLRQNDLGFQQPFAALVLAEVARVDRRKAFMNEAQRQEMVSVAAHYLRDIQDYRGYDEKQGWRHGVAHAADWMMQLSLNPALSKSQHSAMLEALAQQIRNDQHFYQYGEGERLMTPVFYLGLRSALTPEEWDTWFNGLLTTSLDLKKTTQASLARKHNLTAFLSAMYLNLQESKQAALQEKLLPLVIKSLKKLN